MNWQPYPAVKPQATGHYLTWESIGGEMHPSIAYYTEADGFTDEYCALDVSHWCEIVPPGPASASGESR